MRAHRAREWPTELEDLGVHRVRVRALDVFRQAALAIASRPGRTIATCLGTIVGVAAVVATIGMAATASVQVTERFDAQRATTVILQPTSDGEASGGSAAAPIPREGISRVASLNGVVHAGAARLIHVGKVQARPTVEGPGAAEAMPVLAADPGALGALHVRIGSGRTYGRFHEDRRERVALLGRAAADKLGIAPVEGLPAIWIGDTAFTVIGIIDDVERRPSTLLGIFLPTTTADDLIDANNLDADPVEVVIETAPGAAQTIAAQGPYALAPEGPEHVKTLAPPDPDELRGSVEDDVSSLFLIMAALSLIIGAIGIGNTTLVAVLERVPEIGLRRSVGASRMAVAAQFLTESTLLGTAGGIIGCSLGTIVVVALSAQRHWAPTMDPKMVLAAPLLGLATGLVAGLHPAWRAARIEPTEALRR